MVAHSIPQDLIDKIERRRVAGLKAAQTLRRLALFDEEIRDALTRFYAAGGVNEIEHSQGGHSDDRNQRQ